MCFGPSTLGAGAKKFQRAPNALRATGKAFHSKALPQPSAHDLRLSHLVLLYNNYKIMIFCGSSIMAQFCNSSTVQQHAGLSLIGHVARTTLFEDLSDKSETA